MKPLPCPLLCAARQAQLAWGGRVRRKMRAKGNGQERIKERGEVGGSMARPIRLTERERRQWIWHTMPGLMWERAIKNKGENKKGSLCPDSYSLHVSSWHHITSVDWTGLHSQALLPALSPITSLHCHMRGHQHTSVVCSVVSSFVFFSLSGSLFFFFSFVPVRPPCHLSSPPSTAEGITDVMPFAPWSLPPACWRFR